MYGYSKTKKEDRDLGADKAALVCYSPARN